MVEVKKIMEKDAVGIDRQIYPQTVPEAVLGLKKLIQSTSTGASEGFVRLECADTLRAAKDYTDQQISHLDLSGGGSGGTIPGVATPSANGLMSKEDITKLDGIESGAQKNPGMATASQAGLMSATDKQIINVMGTIEFEKVGEV